MESTPTQSQRAEKKPPKMARSIRRRYARELEGFAHREICEQFAIRGADSDIDISEAFEAQRPSVMSILVYELYRRVRRIESQQAMNDRVVSIDTRKGAAA